MSQLLYWHSPSIRSGFKAEVISNRLYLDIPYSYLAKHFSYLYVKSTFYFIKTIITGFSILYQKVNHLKKKKSWTKPLHSERTVIRPYSNKSYNPFTFSGCPVSCNAPWFSLPIFPSASLGHSSSLYQKHQWNYDLKSKYWMYWENTPKNVYC